MSKMTWNTDPEDLYGRNPYKSLTVTPMNPNTVYATIPPMKTNAVGSVRSVLKDDVEIVERLQETGEWVEINSESDEFAGNGKETTKMSTTGKTSNSMIPMADAYFDGGLNVLLIGLHGTGKTASIVEIAKQRNLKMKYFSCATLDPFTDLVGVPTPRVRCEEHGEFESRKEHRDLYPSCTEALSEDLKMIRPHDVDTAEIIFFDEFNRADPKTMNAVFEIIQFQSINGEPLPNLKCCWAAMNPPDPDQKYEVETLDPALLDRFDVYINIEPKPSVSYMSQHMPEPIARALNLWWQEHERKIRGNILDAKIDYLSPRRLEKIGLIWGLTKNARSVNQSLPLGGNFDKQKLNDYLKAAQRKVDGLDPDVKDAPSNIGDGPNASFIYQPANLRQDKREVIDFLTENPGAHETHQKVASAYKQGVGGEELVLKHGEILNALQPATLEGLVNSYPPAKQSQMRTGFSKLYKDTPAEAKKLVSLHKVLLSGAGNSDFPKSL